MDRSPDEDTRADRRAYEPPDIKPAIGRPFRWINYTLVEDLAGIGCTDAEIAGMVGVSEETFRRRKHTEPDLCGALKKGRAEIRQSLRRRQLDIAMGRVEANPETGAIVNPTTMAIFLGKQLLGQRNEPPEPPPRVDDSPAYRVSIGDGDLLYVPSGTDPIDAYQRHIKRHVRSQESQEPE